MNQCTFVDIVPQDFDAKLYVDSCPFNDVIFKRNLWFMMKRMVREEDVVVLHYDTRDVALIYKSQCCDNKQIEKCLLEGIKNMVTSVQTLKDKEKIALRNHIRYVSTTLFD